MLFNSANPCTTVGRRYFFKWLTIIFNRPSETRIKEVGPDRACAEWLLRNGAAVKWKNSATYLKDYNALPQEKQLKRGLYVQGVDATDSGISVEGFSHFSGCRYIEEVKLVNCIYIGDQAIEALSLLRDTLKYLEIGNCGNVSDDGVLSIKNLVNLETLTLYGLPSVKNGEAVKRELEKSLPKCQIDFSC